MNARTEFLDHVKRPPLCAEIRYDGRHYNLPCNFSPEQSRAFLSSLDFEYDDGYGSQVLFGVIWYTDGTWSERGEYDGSEWWVYKSMPEIPMHLTTQ